MTTINNMMPRALYVHVPFCQTICPYCDFLKVIYRDDYGNKYLQSFKEDLLLLQKFDSIYVGGGTPSTLKSQQFDKLLKMLGSHLENDGQLCVELNPETMDNDKILSLVRNKVNRVSIGVQSFQNHITSTLGRKHNAEMVINLINTIKSYGINDISCDLIYGVNGQTIEDLKLDLEILTNTLKINHISTYALQIEDHTMFKINNTPSLSDDEMADMYDYIVKYLRNKGFNRYEVSNFARPGYESRHNLVYWHDEQYVGIGPGASGYEGKIRYDNSKNITNYLNGIKKRNEHILSNNEEEFEYIMLNLRLEEGLNFDRYTNRFGKIFLHSYDKELNILKNKGLVIIDDTHIRVSDHGFYLLNEVLSTLLENLNY